MELRPYQIDLVNKTRVALGAHGRICTQSPTGSGKSKIFIALARMAAAKGFTTLIISESVKIFDQIHEEYHESFNISASATISFIRPGHAYVAMAQTLARRKHLIEQFQQIGNRLLVINDEAHIGTATKLLLQLPDALLIGFTATPAWRWAKHLARLYKSLVPGPQVQELISLGFLADYRHFASVAANLSELRIKAGEYTEESQQHAFEGERVYDQLEKDLKTRVYKKCIIFCASIKQCETLSKVLFTRGFSVVQYHSGLDPKISTYNLRQFTDGPVNICISIQSLTKGFDFPAIDMVILLRATTSLPLYLQMIGRGSRIIPGIKTDFTCIDFGANYSRFGLWYDYRDWEDLFKPSLKKKKEGVAPIKICPECECICPATAPECPECGFIFEKKKKKDIELKVIEVSIKDQLKGRLIGDLNPAELAAYAKLTGQRNFTIRVAKARHLQQPGFLKKFATIMGYKPGWIYYKEQELKGLKEFPFNNIMIQ